jgi:flagellar basal body P-ring formation protein FlgA
MNSTRSVKDAIKVLSVMVLMCAIFTGGIVQTAEAARFDEAAIKKIVKSHIENNMPWPKEDVRIIFPVKINEVVLYGDKISYQVQAKRNDGYIGDAMFAIKFYNNGDPVREENIRLLIEVSRDVVISDRVLSRDTHIKPDDVQVVRKWYSRIPLNTLSEMDEVVGKKMSTTVRPKVELTRNMLKEPAVVKRGSMVKVVLDNGAMQITTVGLSEEDGTRGSIIRVKNMTSKRTIFARVLGESLVGVEY